MCGDMQIEYVHVYRLNIACCHIRYEYICAEELDSTARLQWASKARSGRADDEPSLGHRNTHAKPQVGPRRLIVRGCGQGVTTTSPLGCRRRRHPGVRGSRTIMVADSNGQFWPPNSVGAWPWLCAWTASLEPTSTRPPQMSIEPCSDLDSRAKFGRQTHRDHGLVADGGRVVTLSPSLVANFGGQTQREGPEAVGSQPRGDGPGEIGGQIWRLAMLRSSLAAVGRPSANPQVTLSSSDQSAGAICGRGRGSCPSRGRRQRRSRSARSGG